ncbi:dihydropteroate synthase, partial [bacterium]
MITVAENLTVTRKEIARAIFERDPAPIMEAGRIAKSAGARFIDVNLGPR